MATPFSHKPTLKHCKIYQMLKAQNRARHSSFHTPGHKQRGFDITELAYSDNLANPTGCIAQAEKDIATILHAHKSFILTGGSTAGVLAMLKVASEKGVKKLAIQKNAHKSVFEGCALFHITPVLFHVKQEWQNAIENADGVLITSPSYYGEIPPLQAVRTLCDKQNKLFFIDGAHGGHLHFDERLHASAYADLWVDGVHKSLPALTQGAVVSAKTEELALLLKNAVDTFRTTSPSYPIMASVEYAIKYPRNEKLENLVKAFTQNNERVTLNEDWTKLVARFGKNAQTAFEELLALGVYAEFCDGENILFYLSPATSQRAFSRLCKLLKCLFAKYPYVALERIPAPLVLQKDGATEWIDLDSAVGKICAKECGMFPPCTPLFQKGEVICNEKIALLKSAVNTFGLQKKQILVFKDE